MEYLCFYMNFKTNYLQMKNLLIILLSSLITIAGCKTQKENPSSSASTKENQSVTDKKNNNIQSANNNQDTTVLSKYRTMKFVTAKENDTIFATLTKTPCFGTCPVYKLMIFKSGLALYEGTQHVEKTGRYLVYFSEEELKTIEEKAQEINYFGLKDEYDSPVTDFPTTYTSLRLNGKVKTISNRVSGPKGLSDFEKLIHQYLMQKEFKELPQ